MFTNPVATLLDHEDRVWCVNWDHTGELLVSCGTDKLIRIWKNTKSAEANGAGDLENTCHGKFLPF